jgi:transcriptional regulator GlxA family with amidase domain
MPTNTANYPIEKRQIAFVIFEDVKLLDVSGPLQVFSDANKILGHTHYVTTVASLTGGPVTTDTGVLLNTRRLAGVGLDSPDTLIACGGNGVFEAALDIRMVRAMSKAREKCGRVASCCTGAFLLAACGILDNRRAVTHWQHCDLLAEQYPDITVDPDPIFIEDDDIWTAAGVTAGIDLALAMVEADHGRDMTLKLARELLVYVKRPGGQSQFSEALKQQTRSTTGRFDALHLWMRDNITQDLRVDALARRCAMSPRSFARIYGSETGQTPARMVEQMRVEIARKWLEQSSDNIKHIAEISGFGNDERMRRSFLRQIGISPQAYRQRFDQCETDVESPAFFD